MKTKLFMQAQRKVDAFNHAHPVGTPVRVYPGVLNGRSDDTCTKTKALVLGGHTAVVWVEGHSSCIALSHVTVK